MDFQCDGQVAGAYPDRRMNGDPGLSGRLVGSVFVVGLGRGVP